METNQGIHVNNVSFSYQRANENSLHDINLSIAPGEFVLLCGKSGCGKTTLIRMMNGLIPHYYEGELEGDVFIHGQRVKDYPLYELATMTSTVFQNPKSQFFNLDTTSEILFALENHHTPKDIMTKRLEEVKRRFGIAHLLDRDIFQLSGGEKQMIAIAGAYATDTGIILLDEPTSNLDLASIEVIRKMLKVLKEAGKTIVISEHRLAFLKDLIDRAILLEHGKIVREFSHQEFNALDDEALRHLGLRSLDAPIPKFTSTPASDDSYELKQLHYVPKKAKAPLFHIEDLHLPTNCIIGLVGRNGTGKSTFARCVAGIAKSRGDKVLYAAKRLSSRTRLKLSYVVLQDVTYQLFTESVQEELSLGAHKGLQTVDVNSILDNLGLLPYREAHPLSLSGGEKQRVSIGAGIASGSDIMIFDEPTSGMDRYHMERTAKLIQSLKAPGRLILLITHDMELLSLIGEKLLFMEGGQISSLPPTDTAWWKMIDKLQAQSEMI